MRIISIICAVMLFTFTGCKSKKDKSPQDSDVYYTCSMDPQVIEYKPGKCPICKMELTVVMKSTFVNAGEIQLSEQQIELGNIKVDTIRQGTIGNQLLLTATLNFDQMKTVSVSSGVMGRVERLYFKNVGDYVKRGERLFDLYSEELNTARQEYLVAIERKKTFGKDAVIDFDNLIQGAKSKLLLWGMNESQIEELGKNNKAGPLTTFYSNAGGNITTLDINEGDYVAEGGIILRLTDMSTLWAEAQVYTSQLAELDRDGSAIVQIPDLNNKEIKGHLEFINPEISPDTRINLVRVTIPNTGSQLKPGMPAYVLLKSRQRTGLTLPIDAVIRDARGATVWIKTGRHSFKSKMVEVGLENDDRIEIKSGLEMNDVVVVSGAYLLHSEYIFKKGVDPMAGHKM